MCCFKAKASKGMRKITWPPFIHTSALKIVSLVVWVYSAGFVKCFDILLLILCSFWTNQVKLWIKEKKQQYFYYFKFIPFSSDKSLRALIIVTFIFIYLIFITVLSIHFEIRKILNDCKNYEYYLIKVHTISSFKLICT